MNKAKHTFHGNRYLERSTWGELQTFLDAESLKILRNITPVDKAVCIPYALKLNGTIIGYTALDKATLSNIRCSHAQYVMPEHRGQGHGRYMLDTLKIRLVTAKPYEKALIGFFRSLGFRHRRNLSESTHLLGLARKVA